MPVQHNTSKDKGTVKGRESIFSQLLSFTQTSAVSSHPSVASEVARVGPAVGDEILIKVWVPMEYTGQLYRVRKFSAGKSTQDVVSLLNSQLAPIYQSPKNKLFLNNDDRPVPNVSLKNLNLQPEDILYLRREPEYELVSPAYPGKGSLVLDKDVKVAEALFKIQQWLDFEDKELTPNSSLSRSGDERSPRASMSGTASANPRRYRPEYFHTLEDHNLMIVGGERDGDNHVSSYKLLKKLCLPTNRITGKVSRGYYLRLYDQKLISNYGIKIKDTLIFKKKTINRGLCVDDADGGIEISVIYSPLSMLPTYPEIDPANAAAGGANGKDKEREKNDNPAQKDLLIKVERLAVIDPSMMPTPGSASSQTLLLPDATGGDGTKTRKQKSRRTPSNVGLPFNLVHKTHVDFEYKWSGSNLEDSFEFKEKLGQGGYGAVFRALHRESGTTLAVKVLSITPSRIADIEKEIDLLKKCRCQSVLSYYGSIAKLAELWILMDYCAVGSVKDMMKTCCDTLDEEQIGSVAAEVLVGLGYLHSKGIVHLDVKAANILLNEDGQVKIADFGVSQQLQTPYGQSNILIGSPLYMAPELILKAPFNSKADVWSFGITLIELAEGRPPSRGLKSMAQLTEVPNMPPPKLSNPKDWSPSFNDFIAKCLVKDPEQRPNVGDLLSHPFIQSAKSTECLSNMMRQCVQIKEAQNKDLDPTKE
ncbi:hypothetical protein SAMD00019534_052730 [Acytostelium subglobosum LB1]|uniref:hypothetical protein n=1 Tax=Acytostelium subglobosum LB1 TaxID=1410327 RepID=UPI00064506E7|nr:hypothetical protein SAMD00019534_052730 [Acytostelium subglobosum LB1]GAM22098.1 hypothetical protein SAMD00019534_052730 [Acytostelium subglobosum LB1]|eukprot:XP_012755198.1 hypothetical protein SAMD00019534_052730 [Acytostelium subglobosum LB1]